MIKEFGFYSFNEEKQLSVQQETDTDGCSKFYSMKNTDAKVTREGYCKSPGKGQPGVEVGGWK